MVLLTILAVAFVAVAAVALAFWGLHALMQLHRRSLERRAKWVDVILTQDSYTYISVQRIAETRFSTHLLDERHVGVVWNRSLDRSAKMREHRMRAFALAAELNKKQLG